jgi:hypothetical protein
MPFLEVPDLSEPRQPLTNLPAETGCRPRPRREAVTPKYLAEAAAESVLLPLQASVSSKTEDA